MRSILEELERIRDSRRRAEREIEEGIHGNVIDARDRFGKSG